MVKVEMKLKVKLKAEGSMPEGPEVSRICCRLRNSILDVRIEDFWSRNDGLIKVRATVTDVFSKGKRIVIKLDDGFSIMLIFALSGKLEIFNDACGPEDESTRVIMNFDHDGRIVLKDKLKLATGFFNRTSEIMKLLPPGFDPLCTIEGMNSWILKSRKHQNMLVANFLVDQKTVAGIGNRYRSEIMHVSKIHPENKIKDLTTDKLQILLVNIYRILKSAARGNYVWEVVGQQRSRYTGVPVYHVEVAKGVFVWSVFKPQQSSVQSPGCSKEQKI